MLGCRRMSSSVALQELINQELVRACMQDGGAWQRCSAAIRAGTPASCRGPASCCGPGPRREEGHAAISGPPLRARPAAAGWQLEAAHADAPGYGPA
jgi:hypothetical protein